MVEIEIRHAEPFVDHAEGAMRGAADYGKDSLKSFQRLAEEGITMKSLSLSSAVILFALPVSGLLAQQGAVAPAAASPETRAVSCSRLNVNATSPGELTVSVNGIVVGTFYGDAGVYQDLEPRMKPGVNRVRLSFAAPGKGTGAELRCLPPGVHASRDTILRLQPTAKRLSVETDVNHVPR